MALWTPPPDVRATGEIGRAYDAPRLRGENVTVLAVGARPLPVALTAAPTAAHEWRLVVVSGTVADVHKLGYAPKGASVIVYADKRVRRYQTWVFDGWLGGLYGSPNLQGSPLAPVIRQFTIAADLHESDDDATKLAKIARLVPASLADAQEMIVKVGIMTSSPGPSLSAAQAASRAADPLQTAMPCFRPTRSANFSSNMRMNGPSDDIQPVSMHSFRYFRSLPSRTGSLTGINPVTAGVV